MPATARARLKAEAEHRSRSSQVHGSSMLERRADVQLESRIAIKDAGIPRGSGATKNLAPERDSC